MHPLPVEGWANDRVLYRHLIGPVVAYVRDHGPVTVEQAQHFLTTKATGDLMFASPTYDRRDAASRVMNLMCDDIDVLDREGEKVSVPPDIRTAVSERFGSYSVPSAADRKAAQEASRRRIASNDWVSKRLFATKWHKGIRVHKQPDVDWMVRQIQQFGYVGPLIVRDTETGGIIDGGLRAVALDRLGRSWDAYAVDMAFENDRHRLAYVLAVHTLPGGQLRVPKTLRDAILREVLPHGMAQLRPNGGLLGEPTDEEWQDIVGDEFDHAPMATPVDPKSAGETSTTRPTSRAMRRASVSTERILAALSTDAMTEADFLLALGESVVPSIVGKLVAAGGPIKETVDGGVTKYCLTTTSVPVTLTEPCTGTAAIGASLLIREAQSTGNRMSAKELERRARLEGASPKSHTSSELNWKPNIVWYLDGQGWRLFTEMEDRVRWWWAAREA